MEKALKWLTDTCEKLVVGLGGFLFLVALLLALIGEKPSSMGLKNNRMIQEFVTSVIERPVKQDAVPDWVKEYVATLEKSALFLAQVKEQVDPPIVRSGLRAITETIVEGQDRAIKLSARVSGPDSITTDKDTVIKYAWSPADPAKITINALVPGMATVRMVYESGKTQDVVVTVLRKKNILKAPERLVAYTDRGKVVLQWDESRYTTRDQAYNLHLFRKYEGEDWREIPWQIEGKDAKDKPQPKQPITNVELMKFRRGDRNAETEGVLGWKRLPLATTLLPSVELPLAGSPAPHFLYEDVGGYRTESTVYYKLQIEGRIEDAQTKQVENVLETSYVASLSTPREFEIDRLEDYNAKNNSATVTFALLQTADGVYQPTADPTVTVTLDATAVVEGPIAFALGTPNTISFPEFLLASIEDKATREKQLTEADVLDLKRAPQKIEYKGKDTGWRILKCARAFQDRRSDSSRLSLTPTWRPYVVVFHRKDPAHCYVLRQEEGTLSLLLSACQVEKMDEEKQGGVFAGQIRFTFTDAGHRSREVLFGFKGWVKKGNQYIPGKDDCGLVYYTVNKNKGGLLTGYEILNITDAGGNKSVTLSHAGREFTADPKTVFGSDGFPKTEALKSMENSLSTPPVAAGTPAPTEAKTPTAPTLTLGGDFPSLQKNAVDLMRGLSKPDVTGTEMVAGCRQFRDIWSKMNTALSAEEREGEVFKRFRNVFEPMTGTLETLADYDKSEKDFLAAKTDKRDADAATLEARMKTFQTGFQGAITKTIEALKAGAYGGF